MAEWPAERIEKRDVNSLKPSTRNARTHSAAQIEQLVNSMREWGFTNPILVDETDAILAGNGRLAAAVKLGWTQVPVIVARGWTAEQKRAYIIADNKLALNAGWDDDILRLELSDLGNIGFDISLTGFNEIEVGNLFSDNDADEKNHGALAERFGVPPFSVLRAADGWWQERKRAWLALGIKSEMGRGDAPIGGQPVPLDR